MQHYQKKIPFKVAAEVSQLCQPLFDASGLSFFEYIKSYHDGRFLTLVNKLDWFEHYIDQRYYEISFFRQDPKLYQQSYVFTSSLTQGSQCVQEGAKFFGIDHCLALIEPCVDGCEFYLFATHSDNRQIMNYYLNNLELFKQFCFYFTTKGAKLIQQHANDPFYAPLIQTNPTPADQAVNTNLAATLQPKRFMLNNKRDCYLTPRQIQCIRWLAQGKSYTEIGLILAISPKTVESHFDVIKKRLNCYKSSHLVYLALKHGLIS